MDVIVPAFRIEQTDDHVSVSIQVAQDDLSNGKARAIVDEGVFGVSCGDAHLPLIFGTDKIVNGSASLEENHDSEAPVLLSVDSPGSLRVQLRKTHPGREIEGLGELKPTLFEVPSTGEKQKDEEARLAGLNALRQSIRSIRQDDLAGEDGSSSTSERLPSAPLISTNVKTRMHECFADNDLPPFSQRLSSSIEREEQKWDEGMYLDSFVDEDGEIAHLINAPLKDIVKGATSNTLFGLKTAKEPTLSQEQRSDILLLLVELLLAFAYDFRTTLGEPTVESNWTIAVLSRSLVASCVPSTQDKSSCSTILQGFTRRQLCFGLYRSWSLAQRVTQDVIGILRASDNIKRANACLQHVYMRFEEGQADDDALAFYVDQVIEPLLTHFDHLVDTESLTALADALEQARATLTKEDVGPQWGLEALEDMAKEAIANGQGGFV